MKTINYMLASAIDIMEYTILEIKTYENIGYRLLINIEPATTNLFTKELPWYNLDK